LSRARENAMRRSRTVELSGARAFMRRHSLGILERAGGLEYAVIARRTEQMAAELHFETGISRAPGAPSMG
jgi:hypothetical protein